MENNRTCEICNFDFHRAPFAKYMRSKKHLENKIQDGMITPEWFLE